MQTFAHYALLGTFIAGAAGMVALLLITAKHGLTGRRSRREDRAARVADTVAVVGLAVAVGLGVAVFTQHMRGLASLSDRTLERLTAMEHRLESSEAQLAALTPSTVVAAVPKAWSPASAQPTPEPKRRGTAMRPADTSMVTLRSRSVGATTVTVRNAPPPSPRSVLPRREPTLAEQTARGWDALKRDAQRGGEDLREGWYQLRQAFAN